MALWNRAVWILFLVFVLWPWLSLAQAPAPDSGVDWSDVLYMLLKQVMPILLAFFAPYVTKGMTNLIGSTGKWGPLISSFVAALVSGLSAGMLGQSVDMSSASAAVGAATGAAAHGVMQTQPIEKRPTP